jgi:hypothetical protein
MWGTIKAVLWGFLGIRSSEGYEKDQQKLKLQHVVAVGLVCALVFVICLFFLVRMLTAK